MPRSSQLSLALAALLAAASSAPASGTTSSQGGEEAVATHPDTTVQPAQVRKHKRHRSGEKKSEQEASTPPDPDKTPIPSDAPAAPNTPVPEGKPAQ
ncbi:hypothetical protein [Aurantimonas sp. VKM B-3413]|uniref:hypothetical protein n=1 Tax=Aurantimonas sp. VKM B-3413 TaxID=2779401 RepID=UPI001E5D1493|nr:hypothetical protein [Aurantimonas sp. VKM B-3413]MCB8838202.1 hypothetical protein [Aurantimonas sp. VKM B-3413]